MAEVCRKGTLGSMLAWRAAFLLLIRLLFALTKTSLVRERKRASCRVSLWGDDSRSYNAPGLIPISPIPREIDVFPTHGTFL